MVGVALFLALGGLVAYLAGVTGLNEIRRLRRVGVPALALVRYRVLGPDDHPPSARPLLQFSTPAEQVVEVFSPVLSSRALPLVHGGQVWLRYDPADPREVLLEGRERRSVERAFVIAGALAVLAAVVLVAVVA
ncbi:hypothetical protein GCM10009738_57840 [Kitasatospora viridis]|uniref:DUF3592 domain-containing protein n=2 Tax=Kitasatospora viridis TaxID=281105 RepID=A0A561T6B8_9ACTN|nr:hypothetical protein FHX73_14135 [Kitasatospora viridis]